VFCFHAESAIFLWYSLGFHAKLPGLIDGSYHWVFHNNDIQLQVALLYTLTFEGRQ